MRHQCYNQTLSLRPRRIIPGLVCNPILPKLGNVLFIHTSLVTTAAPQGYFLQAGYVHSWILVPNRKQDRDVRAKNVSEH